MSPFRTRLGSPSPRIVGIPIVAYLLLGSAVEAVDFSVGLLWSQAFLLIGPALLRIRAAGFRPLRFIRADRLPRDKWLVLGAAASAFLCASAMMGFIQSLLPEEIVKKFDMTDMLTQENGVGLYFGIIIGAPLAEEIVFRGTLLPILCERISMRGALLTQALLFSFIHLDPVGFLPRLMLGIAFGLLWLETGSLWSSVLAHALNNGLSSAMFLWGPKDGDGEIGVSSQIAAALITCGAGLALIVFLRFIRKRAAPVALPSEDPAALALPDGGGLLATKAGRRWARFYVASAALGMLLVFALSEFHPVKR